MQSNILDYISWDNHHDTGIIRIDYSPYALNQTRLIQKNGINDQAVMRRKETGISIDGIESLDLDDAIWVEKTKKWYVVFVHISDVAEAIGLKTPLDIEAFKRSTSIYMEAWVLNMVPPLLSQDVLSLNENGEKLTMTMRIEIDDDANITDYVVYESIFKNMRRYDYETFVDDYLNPESEHHATLQLMYEVAKKRKVIRVREWANTVFKDDDRQLYVGSHPEKEHFSRKKLPSQIIEEFMLLANECGARIGVEHGYNTIFRAHYSMDERAVYQNKVWFHTWLACQNYTHFTSPIRRYADLIVHRVLKLVHLRDEPAPYTQAEIADIANHINISRTLIDILGRDADNEMRGKKVLQRLGQRYGEEVNISHMTQSIRETVGNKRKIPRVIVEQIMQDLEHGDKSNWAWAIWVLLVSENDEIRQCLKKVLLDDKKFSAKSVLALLNETKILRTDSENLFKIEEIQEWNMFSICVMFDGECICYETYNNTFWDNPFLWFFENKFLTFFFPWYRSLQEKNDKDGIGITRKKVLEKVIEYFCKSE